MDLSYSHRNRLVTKNDFQSVFANPSKLSRSYLTALYRPNQTQYPRLGIIITKKQVKQAAKRNRLRRIVIESFRHHKELLKGLDIIVLLRSECTALEKKTLVKDESINALRNAIDELWPAILAHFAKSV